MSQGGVLSVAVFFQRTETHSQGSLSGITELRIWRVYD